MRRRWDLAGILFANAVSIGTALLLGWDATEVLALFWWQSVIIGVFSFLRLLTLPVRGGLVNWPAGTPAEFRSSPVPERVVRVLMAGFFAMHYGGFHLAYLAFLSAPAAIAGGQAPLAGSAILGAFLPALTFLPGHLASYLSDLRGPGLDVSGLQAAFTAPYARIIPMHLTIVLGGFLAATLPPGAGQSAVLVLFMILKAWVDVRGHLRQHAGQPTGPG